jgi:biotin synthase
MAKDAGISVCSGGIFGVGESNEDRVSLFSLLRELDVDSIPINFLVPIAGTPLFENDPALGADEALRIIAVSRLFFPKKEVRICGGRIHALKDRHPEIFYNGADGVMIGNYLTRSGRSPDLDIQMIREEGFDLVPPHALPSPTVNID